MSKPLGYYTSHRLGDNSLISAMEKKYGSQLEGITPEEKLFLIESLADSLDIYTRGIRNEIFEAKEDLAKLSRHERLNFIEALVSQMQSHIASES